MKFGLVVVEQYCRNLISTSYTRRNERRQHCSFISVSCHITKPCSSRCFHQAIFFNVRVSHKVVRNNNLICERKRNPLSSSALTTLISLSRVVKLVNHSTFIK